MWTFVQNSNQNVSLLHFEIFKVQPHSDYRNQQVKIENLISPNCEINRAVLAANVAPNGIFRDTILTK